MTTQPLDIIKYQGDEKSSILRQVAIPVEDPSDTYIKTLVDQIVETAKTINGLAIAAPQVGHSVRLFVMQTNHGLTAYANPVILKKVGTIRIVEGCLSIPGIQVKKVRAKQIKMRAYDVLLGQEVTIKYRDLEAACVQHEIDHLDGVLIIDS